MPANKEAENERQNTEHSANKINAETKKQEEIDSMENVDCQVRRVAARQTDAASLRTWLPALTSILKGCKED